MRHGDHISPYLLVLSMEYISWCSDDLKEDMISNYHVNCTRTRTTLLLFDGYLLFFSMADVIYVQMIFDKFKKILIVCGLSANPKKCASYMDRKNGDE